MLRRSWQGGNFVSFKQCILVSCLTKWFSMYSRTVVRLPSQPSICSVLCLEWEIGKMTEHTVQGWAKSIPLLLNSPRKLPLDLFTWHGRGCKVRACVILHELNAGLECGRCHHGMWSKMREMEKQVSDPCPWLPFNAWLNFWFEPVRGVPVRVLIGRGQPQGMDFVLLFSF